MTAQHAGRDLVVVGASAGGVEALKTLVADLPPDLPAAVLVALHLPVDVRSYLPGILQRRCPLPVLQAEDGLALRSGQVVVAPSDAHLLVLDDQVVLGRGPRESGARPAHDAMLRSAALARGPRTVAVVMTGLLDDGAAGLRVVERYGGACVVQDPGSAEFSSMPEAALAAVPAARVVPLAALAATVQALVREPPPPAPPVEDALRRRDAAELERSLGRARDPCRPEGRRLPR